MTAVATTTSLEHENNAFSSASTVSSAAAGAIPGSKTAVFAADDVDAACQVLWADFTAGRGVRWGSWIRNRSGKLKLKYPEPKGKGGAVAASAQLPTDRHVAANTYDENGFTRWVPVDLDLKNGTDAEGLVRVAFELHCLLGRVGGRYVRDQSQKSEGMHVLIPLAEPAHHDEVAPVIRGLQRWARQWADVIDTRPALGPGGACITLPGTLDKGRIPRQLQQDPEVVIVAITERSAPGLLERLAAELGEYMNEPAVAQVDTPPVVPRPRASTGETMLQAFARGGAVPAGYRSSSEARLGAIRSLAGTGYDQEGLWGAIGDGTFAGIAESYLHNYSSLEAARERFDREWVKAVTGMGPVISPGSHGTRHIIRAIFTAIRIEAGQATSKADRSRIAMLLSAAYMASVCGSLEINPGCRALTFAAGLPAHSGIADHMNIEAARPDSFLVKTGGHSRDEGARWRLQLPTRHAWLADPEHTGQVKATAIEPVHPVYAKLGVSAMWLLDALEEHGPLRRLQLVSRSGVSQSHVDKLLKKLVDKGLVTRDADGTIRRTSLGLDKAARRLGVPEMIQARRDKYAEQRADWRKFWDQVVATPDPSAPKEEPPPADAWFAAAVTEASSPPAGADPPA